MSGMESTQWTAPCRHEPLHDMPSAPYGVNLVFWWKGYRMMADTSNMCLVGQRKRLGDGYDRVVCETGAPYDPAAFAGWQYMEAGGGYDVEPTPDTPPGFTARIWANPTGQEVLTMLAPDRPAFHVLVKDCPKYLLAAYGHIVTTGAGNVQKT